MSYPEKLRKGDTIAFFSPSTPITAFCPKRFARAKAFLEGKGYRLLPGKLTGKADGYRSGSALERAGELNELILNPEVKCIISTIGGYNSNSLLPYIDYESFKKNPKIIVGYSDVTAILLAVYAVTGITTYYGPALVASFGELPPFVDMTFKYFENILAEGSYLPYKLPTPEVWSEEFIDWETQSVPKTPVPNKLITVSGGKARGRVIGGNLNTMTGIWGSRYMPEIREGDILFIEDTELDAQKLEREYAHLKCCGIFDRISGLILGKHEKYNDRGTGRQPCDILCEIIGTTRFPILADFDCGHTHPMLCMPIGAVLELDADKQEVIICE